MNLNNTKTSILVKVLALLVSVGALVGLDQWTKVLAREQLKNCPKPIIDGVFELHYVENTGAVWGIMAGKISFLVLITSLITLLLLYVYIVIPAKKRYLPMLAIDVFIIAGAIGNFIDRVTNQYVTDFLYFKLIDFPVFNVADIYVTVSAFLMLILAFTLYRTDDWAFLTPWKNKGEAKSE